MDTQLVDKFESFWNKMKDSSVSVEDIVAKWKKLIGDVRDDSTLAYLLLSYATCNKFFLIDNMEVSEKEFSEIEIREFNLLQNKIRSVLRDGVEQKDLRLVK